MVTFSLIQPADTKDKKLAPTDELTDSDIPLLPLLATHSVPNKIQFECNGLSISRTTRGHVL